MKPHPLGGYSIERGIRCFDINFSAPAFFLFIKARLNKNIG